MKTSILLLSLLAFVLIAAEGKKHHAPVLPDRFMALGNFWVIDQKGDTLLDYGHFNKKYDWKSGIERVDKLIAPESQTDANFMTIWKTKDTTLVSVLDDQDLKINCTEKEHWGTLMPPDFLSKHCNFHSLDSANGHLAKKWFCEIEDKSSNNKHKSHVIAWTHAIEDHPLKIAMHFKKVSVVLDFTAFHVVDSFDEDLFVPPKAWNCPSL